jgi:LuxR family maltose regulon positive regulatory protein
MAIEATIDPLLSTKLHRPPVDGNHVHRPNLLGRLDQSRSRPLTLVSAPAGYGKTVLVSCWLEQLLGFPIDPSTAVAVEKKTEGWVTGLRLTALSMRHRGNLDPRLLEPQVDARYVMEYLFTEVFSHQPPEISQYLMAAAILDRFCGPLCEAICVSQSEPFTCEIGGWEFIDWLKKENLFLIALDAENRWFRFHHLFKSLLFNQLKRHFSYEYINALHANASAWFSENGLLEAALQHALAAGNTETAAGLVAEFSPQLMNAQQWSRLERCLNQLPRDRIEQDPALLVLEAWLHVV